MILRPNRQMDKDLMLAFTCTATQFFHDNLSRYARSRVRESIIHRVEDFPIVHRVHSYDFVLPIRRNSRLCFLFLTNR
jgi:hypothetical protein